MATESTWPNDPGFPEWALVAITIVAAVGVAAFCVVMLAGGPTAGIDL